MIQSMDCPIFRSAMPVPFRLIVPYLGFVSIVSSLVRHDIIEKLDSGLLNIMRIGVNFTVCMEYTYTIFLFYLYGLLCPTYISACLPRYIQSRPLASNIR